jgi:hypothetical protein
MVVAINPGSLVTSRLRMFFKETELSLGTSFFYERNGSHYLITNWHNVSGRDPKIFKPLSDHAGLPDRVSLTICKSGQLGQWLEGAVLLYSDAGSTEQPTNPVWYVHPQLHQRVDVVAIPFQSPAETQIYPINTMNTVPNMRLIVSGDVFVLGYPKGISGGGAFPIWKRASLATAPELDLNDLPMMLVDTATREGMSGGPVLAVATNGYTTENGTTHIGAQGTRFAGIYSGRLGANELEAQLGVVWKARVLDEIIDGHVTGTSSFLWAA